MKYAQFFAASLLLSLSLAMPALAHHSFAAEFDGDKTVTVKGVLTKVDWINPHVYFYLDVKDDAGKVASWEIETWPTGFLHKSGINRAMFVGGQTVTAFGYRAKDGTKNYAYLGSITFADGSHFDLGGGGRPDPATDPNNKSR